jgi:nicotinamidase-related amidase
MNLIEKNPVLLLIDVQVGMDDEAHWGGNRNNKDAESKIVQLLERWRSLDLPVIHVQHSAQDPASKLHASHPGFAIKEIVKPKVGEAHIVKNVNSAFIGTNLQAHLDGNDLKTLVIVGLTTNHCVSTTARMAGNLGYDTYLISDATATFDRIGIHGEHYSAELIHLTTLANLQEEFVQVLSSRRVLKELAAN